MKYEIYSHSLKRSESDKKNLKLILQKQWESIVQLYQKWRQGRILVLAERLNLQKFLVANYMLNMEIKIGGKYWTLKPPMDSAEKFVRPWLVEYYASDQGVDYFKDEKGNGFLISSQKDPAEFLFQTAETALNAYYHRKIQMNEQKVMELLQENAIYYTMTKSIL
jgi:hypothetical protein